MSWTRGCVLGSAMLMMACGGVAGSDIETASPVLPDLLPPVDSPCYSTAAEHPSLGLIVEFGGRIQYLRDSTWVELYRSTSFKLATLDGEDLLVARKGRDHGLRIGEDGREIGRVASPTGEWGLSFADGRLYHTQSKRADPRVSLWQDGDWVALPPPPMRSILTQFLHDDGRYAAIGGREIPEGGTSPGNEVLAVWDGSAWLKLTPAGMADWPGAKIVGWEEDQLWVLTTDQHDHSDRLWRISVRDGSITATSFEVPVWEATIGRGPDGRWHLVGGRIEYRGKAATTHLVFDETRARWVSGVPLLYPRRCGSLSVTEYGLLLFGGLGVGPVLPIEHL